MSEEMKETMNEGMKPNITEEPKVEESTVIDTQTVEGPQL